MPFVIMIGLVDWLDWCYTGYIGGWCNTLCYTGDQCNAPFYIGVLSLVTLVATNLVNRWSVKCHSLHSGQCNAPV